MVMEVRTQFNRYLSESREKTLVDFKPAKEDYERCIKISTDTSLKEMRKPGILVILSPILTGTLLGVHAVTGLLAGALVSAVQLAISSSNSGGAWDNAKKQ